MEEKISGNQLTDESPQSLEELKYCFNDKGELRHIHTSKPYVFNYFTNELNRNHQRYQVLGGLITQHVYRLLQEDCKLKRVCIPVISETGQARSFFFMSENALVSTSSLTVLLQDHGVIRAGQWSLKTIVHGCLNHGTQIPYIQKVLSECGEIIVLNPNENLSEISTDSAEAKSYSVSNDEPFDNESKLHDRVKNKSLCVSAHCSSTPEEHTVYVWDHFISKCAAKNVAFIAHGYGGLVFVELLIQRKQEVMDRVFAVAFIDSLHNAQHQGADNEILAWIEKHCQNWVLSPEPVDRVVSTLKVDCRRVSAGTENHELAPWICFQPVFKFFNRTLKAKEAMLSRVPVVTRSSTRKSMSQH
ncbi:putative protein FAM172B [Protopterus annectens]|uniref:putative protein FAM172B n=1 Tax=Protopterus annectens TaxID=7888 RepID=UPI001CFB03B4|nr:putative protein FAM172B [Protopterus annectens]XP_043927733.1 putative protein FAM172B [Protopterus annectens]XP_043927734.1 putative protein FAM172B [Protopterus annectens]